MSGYEPVTWWKANVRAPIAVVAAALDESFDEWNQWRRIRTLDFERTETNDGHTVLYQFKHDGVVRLTRCAATWTTITVHLAERPAWADIAVWLALHSFFETQERLARQVGTKPQQPKAQPLPRQSTLTKLEKVRQIREDHKRSGRVQIGWLEACKRVGITPRIAANHDPELRDRWDDMEY